MVSLVNVKKYKSYKQFIMPIIHRLSRKNGSVSGQGHVLKFLFWTLCRYFRARFIRFH